MVGEMLPLYVLRVHLYVYGPTPFEAVAVTWFVDTSPGPVRVPLTAVTDRDTLSVTDDVVGAGVGAGVAGGAVPLLM